MSEAGKVSVLAVLSVTQNSPAGAVLHILALAQYSYDDSDQQAYREQSWFSAKHVQQDTSQSQGKCL